MIGPRDVGVTDQATGPVTGYRVRVTRAPASTSDSLVVALVDTADTDSLGDTVANWPTRTPLPDVGDEGLAIYDNRLEPWIVAWQT